MGIFQGYFDESGKIDKPVVAFCGFVAAASKFQAFDDEWNSILRSYELDVLTMKRAFKAHVPLSPRIRKQTFAERIETLKPFADCIRKHLEYGVAIAVDVVAFKSMSPGAKRQLGNAENPHYLAFLQGMTSFLHHLRRDDRVSFICDDDEETAWNCYQFYRQVRKIDPVCKKLFVSISFAQDHSFPALQAADFLAALSRMRARYLFFGTPYDYAPLFEYLTTPQPLFNWGVGFWDKDKLKAWEPRLVARNKKNKNKKQPI
ncbi:MAG TPA: DUF3800 domain-containing protein [Terracidiphilus sp.]